jgi:hypothetical protein
MDREPGNKTENYTEKQKKSQKMVTSPEVKIWKGGISFA